jgi:diguanylate cyclase (GGDEF)-like protein
MSSSPRGAPDLSLARRRTAMREGRGLGSGRLRGSREAVEVSAQPGSAGCVARERLTHRLTHDHLTDLPNRALLEEALAATASTDGHAEQVTTLYVLALDRFRFINSSRGHHAGDELLVAVTSRLAQWGRGGDLVARLDGDSFAIACHCRLDDGGLVDHAPELLGLFEEPFAVPRLTQFLSVSIGVAVVSTTGSNTGDLLIEATAAVHAAKVQGGGMSVVHDASMRHRANRRHETENDLHHALRAEQFRVVYQPQINLSTGLITGAEALVRWERPGHGLVGPSEFVTIAEDSGLILPLGAWVLEQACVEAATWASSGRSLTVAVNLSARQLVQPNLPDIVTRVLQDTGLPPSLLCLEVTESVLLEDLDVVAGLLGALRETGVALHIDDFGTGYSSLTYLRHLPVTGIKIDRAFVHGMTTAVADRAIISATTHLGRVMGLDVIAEGVEQPEELRMVRELGCTHGQGYLWSRPVAAEELLNRIVSLSPPT